MRLYLLLLIGGSVSVWGAPPLNPNPSAPLRALSRYHTPYPSELLAHHRPGSCAFQLRIQSYDRSNTLDEFRQLQNENTRPYGPDLTGQYKLAHDGFGHATIEPGLFSRYFYDFVPQAPGGILDIGCAYGTATVSAALALDLAGVPEDAPNGTVLAIDVEPFHLKVLRELMTPKSLKSRIRTRVGTFPNLDIAPESQGAIFIGGLFQYFSGPDLEAILPTVVDWLAPGGILFIEGQTPRLRSFRLVYDQYLVRRQLGEPWPGWVTNPTMLPPGRNTLKPLNLMDPAIIRRFLQGDNRLEDIVALYFPRSRYPEDLLYEESAMEKDIRAIYLRDEVGSPLYPFESVGGMARKSRRPKSVNSEGR
jgi:SAM-dependent methyltransferase